MLGDVVQGAVGGVVEWTLDLVAGRFGKRRAERSAGRVRDRDLAAAEAGRPASLACGLRWSAAGRGTFMDGWLRVNQGEPFWWGRHTSGEVVLPAGRFVCVERRIALPGECFRGAPGTSFVLRLRGPDGTETALSVLAPAAPYLLGLLTGSPRLDPGK
ncbi:hypothetical protein ACIBL6_46865 [Streptomyces sp. NPDC050400]|uniref:hypothetical protein n=1 Tax=Streptomyces sp. NPDC050400 TaxID=3365610 RepID=UPI0037B58733